MPRFLPLSTLRRETGSPVGAAIARAIAQPSLLIILLLSVAGAAHILLRTAPYGAGLTADGTTFLSAGLNLAAGESLQHSRGAPLTDKPALFPLLMAFLSLFGVAAAEAGRWLNALAFGLVILTAGLWLRANLRSAVAAVAATGLLAVSVDFNHHFATLMSDPLFVLFTLLALLQLAAYRRVEAEGRRRQWRPLLLAAVLAGLAAVTRYPGVVLIGSGALLLLLPVGGWSRAARGWIALGFGLAAALPLAVNLSRNWLVSGTFTGPRTEKRGDAVGELLEQPIEALGQWLLPAAGPDWLTYGALAAAAAILAAAIGILWTSRRPPGPAAGGRGGRRLIITLAIFAPSYLAFLAVVMPLFYVWGATDGRYLLPLYVPLLLAAALLLDQLLSSPLSGRLLTARRVLVGIIALGVLLNAGTALWVNFDRTARGLESGYIDRLYNTAYWSGSETLDYVQAAGAESKFISNNPYALWAADRAAPPGKYQTLSFDLADMAQRRGLDTEGRPIVWFKESAEAAGFYRYNEFDARALPGVEVMADLADGVILRYPPGRVFEAAEFEASKADYFEGLKAAAGELVAQGGGFEVYRNGQRLTYYREQCAAGDTAARFFLHIDAVAAGDLPGWARRYGYENRDFDFRRRGLMVDGECIAVVELPDYPISGVRTGQFEAGSGRVWEGELRLGE